jgi:ribosomal 30S subunit maturation factor RimM
MSARLKIGALKGPHGLQGWVKAALTLEDPQLLAELGTCQLEDGRALTITGIKQVGQGLMAIKIEGIDTPEATAPIRGALYLDAAAVPVDDDEILLADLLGQPLYGPDETTIVGTITDIRELPAGPALTITLPAVEGAPTPPKPKTALVPLEEEFILLDAEPIRATLTELGLALLAL